MRCNCIVKKYPNGDISVKKTKFVFVKDDNKNVFSDVCLYDSMHNGNYISPKKAYLEEEYRTLYLNSKVKDNLIKTKEKIYDLANANEWNYFVTLTFSADKCDRYSFNQTSKKVREFFKNYRQRKDKAMKYLIVHETHKDGAYHYHGLLQLNNLDTLKNSGHSTRKGQIIYNWHSYKLGFSTVTEIDNLDASRWYITKYLDKDMDKDYVKGQRRFYYSQNCVKPTKDVAFNYNVDGFDFCYETEYSVGYERRERLYIDKMIDYFGNIEILED